MNESNIPTDLRDYIFIDDTKLSIYCKVRPPKDPSDVCVIPLRIDVTGFTSIVFSFMECYEHFNSGVEKFLKLNISDQIFSYQLNRENSNANLYVYKNRVVDFGGVTQVADFLLLDYAEPTQFDLILPDKCRCFLKMGVPVVDIPGLDPTPDWITRAPRPPKTGSAYAVASVVGIVVVACIVGFFVGIVFWKYRKNNNVVVVTQPRSPPRRVVEKDPSKKCNQKTRPKNKRNFNKSEEGAPPSSDAKNRQKAEQPTSGGTTPSGTVIVETDLKSDVSPQEAAYKHVVNKRLKSLVKYKGEVQTKNLNGVNYWLLPSASDSRNKADDYAHIKEVIEAQGKVSTVKMNYLLRDPQAVQMLQPDEDVKIENNRKQYLLLGPPKLSSISTTDMISCDSMPRYLYNIMVINNSDLEEMETLLNQSFLGLNHQEYKFFEADFESGMIPWKCLQQEKIDHVQKNIKKKEDNVHELAQWIGFEGLSMFHSLVWFYEVYGKYLSSFPLHSSHLSRLPLQGLMMLLFRTDLTQEMEQKIVMWFKITAFGLMRKIDYGSCKESISYPMTVITKIWYLHDFSQLTDDEIFKIRAALDDEMKGPDQDWECI